MLKKHCFFLICTQKILMVQGQQNYNAIPLLAIIYGYSTVTLMTGTDVKKSFAFCTNIIGIMMYRFHI